MPTGRIAWAVCASGLACACGGGGVIVDAGADDSETTDGWLEEIWAADRIMIVTAHPDDEISLAPVLAEACIEKGAECTFLVLTRGEGGACKLPPAACEPDLGTVRSAEMSRSAEVFAAELLLWDLGNVDSTSPDEAGLQWANNVGGVDALVSIVAAEIARIDPDLIFTFDPRHGVTCHPEHRAAGVLALAAANSASESPRSVFVAEARTRIDTGPDGQPVAGYEPWVAEDGALRTYDANRPLPSRPGTVAWDVVVELMTIHASQFYPSDVVAVDAAGEQLRVVPLLRASDVVAEDPRYQGLCQ